MYVYYHCICIMYMYYITSSVSHWFDEMCTHCSNDRAGTTASKLIVMNIFVCRLVSIEVICYTNHTTHIQVRTDLV